MVAPTQLTSIAKRQPMVTEYLIDDDNVQEDAGSEQ
jgi:hypothetical protein